MDPINGGILGRIWRPVLELGLASKDSFVYLLHLLSCHFNAMSAAGAEAHF